MQRGVGTDRRRVKQRPDRETGMPARATRIAQPGRLHKPVGGPRLAA